MTKELLSQASLNDRLRSNVGISSCPKKLTLPCKVPGCVAVFSSVGNRNRHEKYCKKKDKAAIIREREFSCGTCGWKFGQKYDLVRHRKVGFRCKWNVKNALKQI
jgi:hypothetical protein